MCRSRSQDHRSQGDEVCNVDTQTHTPLRYLVTEGSDLRSGLSLEPNEDEW